LSSLILNLRILQKVTHKVHVVIQKRQGDYTGGSTLTIFAITRFLIVEKIFRLARKRHTYGAISLSHYFIYYQLGFASGCDKVKLIKI
jgi:hypothetical protein